MRTISAWAHRHNSQARFIIIISWILLTFLGMYIGSTLKELETILPMQVFSISVILFLVSFVVYPLGVRGRMKKNSYFFRKSCDFVVGASSFIMVVCAANQPSIFLDSYQSIYAALHSRSVVPKDSARRTYQTINEFSASMKDKEGKMLKWKERKKLLKAQVKGIRKSSDTTKGEKTALIILSAIVALGLLALVASAACSLSCNGSDAAAILVGVGGTALVIWLLIVVIRKIRQKSSVSSPGVSSGQ